MGDARRAAGGADAAHHAVEGQLRALLVVAALGIGDVLHHVQALGAGVGAGVAAHAGVDLRIELHHDGLIRGNLLDVVALLDEREEGQRRHVHVVLHLGGAGQAGLELAVALDAVHRGARAAEAVAAAAATHQLVAGVFHCLHDRQIGGNLIFLAVQKNIDQFCHCDRLRINTRWAARPAGRSGIPGRPCRRTCRRCCTFRTCRCRTSCAAPWWCRSGCA